MLLLPLSRTPAGRRAKCPPIEVLPKLASFLFRETLVPILTVKVLTQCLLSPILTHRAESRTGPGPGSGSGSASPTSTP
ncbi:unnamed protein product [Hymenolepis diminuta]|uniref:Uncharacterized protein n=1 Tax=Hymenolepis diminuta TaxID=6216 RepID=A0A564Z1M7_HYMDI|nr:unnamed protein product [Hymenolepis diminuta]